MINDIVTESTDLEFPEEKKSSASETITVSELEKTLKLFRNIFPGSKK